MSESKEIVKANPSISWEKALELEDWKEPLTNIFETDDDYVLILDVPGVSRENLKIKIENATLVVMGRIDFKNAASKNYVLRESEVSNYYRMFNISDSVEIEKVEAELINGQLKLTLPKHERVKPRVINIK